MSADTVLIYLLLPLNRFQSLLTINKDMQTKKPLNPNDMAGLSGHCNS